MQAIGMKVAIIGYGWVGKAMGQLFPGAVVYDIAPYGIGTEEQVNACDVAFVCVPTPCHSQGSLDTSILEEVVSWCEAPLIVIRSTVNPGDADKLAMEYGKRIVVQPEYLGETTAHPLLDTKTRPFLIIGGDPEDRRNLIELYQTVYNANITIRQMSAYEAEVVKLSENRAIAFKVAQCQELFDACEAAGIDYYAIREAVYGDDPRMNLWFSFVYPDRRGMDSKCIPKDVYAWAAWAESVGASASITRSILDCNKRWLQSNVSLRGEIIKCD
jgi:UDPglucose 6-dehydrogenase